MVLDFGLQTNQENSKINHSISSTHLRSLKNSTNTPQKKRHASSTDYASSSSSEEDESDDDSSSSYNDYDYDYDYDKDHDPVYIVENKRGSNSNYSRSKQHRKHHGPSTAKRMSYNNNNPRGEKSASEALAAMLSIEFCEDEVATGHHNLRLAADLEAELYQDQQQQQQHAAATAVIADDSGDEEEEDEQDNNEESQDFLDSLDEVHTRFLLNVPPEELSTSERIFFQLEQAWWYYEDLICDKLEQEQGYCPLPRFANLKPFSKRLFEFSPLLRGCYDDLDKSFNTLWKEFTIYKRKISTYGCILLNEDCTHVVLCKLYKSNVWTFPAGKINHNEIGVDAAARETYEETGFDPHCEPGRGLTAQWLSSSDPEENNKITWSYPLLDEEDALAFVEQPSGKQRTCYVCCGVPEDFPFEPVCRKEVDNIEWIDLRDIKDYKSFAVLPFIGKLKKWIKRRYNNNSNNNTISNKEKKTKKKKERKANKSRPKSRPKSRDKSSTRDKSSSRQRQSSRKKEREQQLVDAGLMASMGDSARWTAEEMFEANSKLQGGRIVEYDGNPHEFAEKGFGIDDEATGQKRVDPHSFRVVGGSFMNSQHGDQLAEVAAANAGANYQPLVRENGTGGGGDDDDDARGLQPFFSQHGVTPWGDVVEEAKSDDDDDDVQSFAEDPATDNNNNNQAGRDLLSMLQQKDPTTNKSAKKKPKSKSKKTKQKQPQASEQQQPVSGDYDYDNSDHDDELMIFATDKEITAKKQRDYERQKGKENKERGLSLSASQSSSSNATKRLEAQKRRLLAQYENDMQFVHNWVASSLPNPTNFKIHNVDAIIDQHVGGWTCSTNTNQGNSNSSSAATLKLQRSSRPPGRGKNIQGAK